VSADLELQDRLRRYYTTYYRDVLGIPDWPVLVDLRGQEEQAEGTRLERLRRLIGDGPLHGCILNVGCGTGGFTIVAAETAALSVGIDADANAVDICALKRLDAGRGRFVRAAAEALPFADGTFDLVYCFSAIEHVDSVEASVREMVRVTRPSGVVYVHTPNAWSWYEGHYKLLWMPFLPRALGRLYLRLRGRPAAYLATLRRLTPTGLRRAFRAAGVMVLTFHGCDDRPRESVGPFRRVLGLYYRLSGVLPFIEVVARKP
jgi:SAM-dependent methyltransferase